MGQFSAASLSSRHSFSRSYGVILPSSLTMLLPSALGFSPHPPVSVYGTGTCITIAAFLGSSVRILHYFCSLAITYSDCETDLPISLLSRLVRSFHSRSSYLSASPQFCVPRLRSRLPQSRSALLWKPWIFGRKDSHLPLATHSGILSSIQSTPPFGNASSRIQCSSTDDKRHPMASVSCFSPGHFRRRASRLVSYYALFECMAASEPTS